MKNTSETPVTDATNNPQHPAWLEYDAAAKDMARKGLKGEIGDPLPLNMSAIAVELINEDPEAFQELVKGFAYQKTMFAASRA